MPVRSPGAIRHSTSRSTCRPSNDTDTSSRSMTSLPSRAVASLASSIGLRSGGTSAISCVGGFDAELRLRRPRRRAAAQPGQLLAHQVLALGLRSSRPDPVPFDPLQDVGRVAAVERFDDARRAPPTWSVATSSRNHRSWVTTSRPPLVRAQRVLRCPASQVMPSMSRWLVGSSSAMTSQSSISSCGQLHAAALAARQRRHRRVPGDVGDQTADDVADPGVTGPLVVGLVADQYLPDGAGAVQGVGLVQCADPHTAAAGHPAANRA